MANPNHDQRGRFSSGSGGTDTAGHIRTAYRMAAKHGPNHPGVGVALRKAAAAEGDHLAAMHPDQTKRDVPGHGTVDRSVPVVPGPRLSAAASDAVIRGKGTDQRHFPNRGPEATAATDLGKPMASQTATPGRFKYQSATAQINARMSATASPVPRMQPTAGQLIGAKIIKGN